MAWKQYAHGHVIYAGRPLLDVEAHDVSVKSASVAKLTGGHEGILPRKNPAVDATMSIKTATAKDGPEADYMSNLRQNATVLVQIVDRTVGGLYRMRVTEIALSDDYAADQSYTVSLEGHKIS